MRLENWRDFRGPDHFVLKLYKLASDLATTRCLVELFDVERATEVPPVVSRSKHVTRKCTCTGG